MNKYELVVILNSQMPQTEKDNISKQTSDAITKNGGKVINCQVWLEKHKLAFKIKRCLEGTYYLVKFESLTTAVGKIKEVLRLNEAILRFAIFKAE